MWAFGLALLVDGVRRYVSLWWGLEPTIESSLVMIGAVTYFLASLDDK